MLNKHCCFDTRNERDCFDNRIPETERSPQRLKNLYFFGKNNLILGLFR